MQQIMQSALESLVLKILSEGEYLTVEEIAEKAQTWMKLGEIYNIPSFSSLDSRVRRILKGLSGKGLVNCEDKKKLSKKVARKWYRKIPAVAS